MLIKKEKIPVKKIATVGILPSFLKKIYYKVKGYKIGKDVSIGFGSVIIGDKVVIENGTKIGFLSVVRAKSISIGRFVKIGSMTMIDTERIEIGDDSRINEQVIIGGLKDPDSFIKLGKRTIIMEYSFINPTKPIIIGDDTGIGGHCLLFTHGSWLSQLEGYPVTFAPITLGKKVWLPWRVFIMPGVTIGDNVVIGANSLVSSNIPSNCLIAGSPAKIKKENYPSELSDEEKSKVINNIFEEFINYLNFFDFSIEKIDITENNFVINVIKKNNISEIFYIQDENNEINPKSYDNVLLLNTAENNISEYLNLYKMVINIKLNIRTGSSNVGEELVNYLSRYGIRFDRID